MLVRSCELIVIHVDACELNSLYTPDSGKKDERLPEKAGMSANNFHKFVAICSQFGAKESDPNDDHQGFDPKSCRALGAPGTWRCNY